jgi:hypothetical protein
MKEPAVQSKQEGAGANEGKGKEVIVADPMEQQPNKVVPMDGLWGRIL